MTSPTDDLRSYHVSSEKIQRELGWRPRFGVRDAVRDLCDAYMRGDIPEPEHPRYRNIAVMQQLLAEGKICKN